jgi:hypothetical protein
MLVLFPVIHPVLGHKTCFGLKKVTHTKCIWFSTQDLIRREFLSVYSWPLHYMARDKNYKNLIVASGVLFRTGVIMCGRVNFCKSWAGQVWSRAGVYTKLCLKNRNRTNDNPYGGNHMLYRTSGIIRVFGKTPAGKSVIYQCPFALTDRNQRRFPIPVDVPLR